MLRRFALLAVLLVGAACTPGGSSPADGLETTPAESQATTPTDATTPSESPAEESMEPSESPAAS